MLNRKLKHIIIGLCVVVTAQVSMYAKLSHTNQLLKDDNEVLITQSSRNRDALDTAMINNHVLQTEVNSLNSYTKDMETKYDELCTKVSVNPQNILQPSNATVYHIRKALKGTQLESLAPSFVQAEQTYGINAYVLAGIVAHESGWGTSNRAHNDNNLTGFCVYSPISRGSRFDSKSDSIMMTAKLLKSDYATQSGKYYNGTSLDSVNTNYCMLEDGTTPDYRWCQYIESIANKLVNKSNK